MDLQRWIEIVENSMHEEADDDAVRELVLYIENDGTLYDRQMAPIQKNLSKKFKKGIYDHEKAKKLWYYLTTSGAKQYGEEHGTKNGLAMFSPDTRRAAAAEMADSWHSEMEAGNFHESTDEQNLTLLSLGENSFDDEAREELESILDQLEQLGEQAKALTKQFYPDEYESLKAYGAFDFGSSSNPYDTTFAGFVERLGD